MTDLPTPTPEDAAFTANQQAQYAAEQAAENARAAAVTVGYPRVLSSGGARDGTTVYQSVVTLEYDTEAEAVAAADQARADGRYVPADDGTGGAPVQQTPGGYAVAIELDASARYPLSDHTGGR